MGELGAVFVDAKDHIWVIPRPRTLTADQIGASLKPPTSECCVPAPPVIEFDQDGRVVQSWDGPGPGKGASTPGASIGRPRSGYGAGRTKCSSPTAVKTAA